MDNKKIGFKEGDLETIIVVLRMYPQIEKALIFGSRAKGVYKSGSDVDLALKGAVKNVASKISYILNEESLLPYKFDVLDYDGIDNPKLVDHIDRVGVVIYKKRD